MYCTLEQLADANLARELAEVCTPTNMGVIPVTLMEATLRGTERTGHTEQSLIGADAALRTIEQSLRQADTFIDGYLRARKPVPYVVPLATVPDNVALWARWITRYLLHKDRISAGDQQDPIVRDYREAVRFLQAVANGTFSLGPEDPLPPSANGVPPQYEPGPRTFTRETLRDFGT